MWDPDSFKAATGAQWKNFFFHLSPPRYKSVDEVCDAVFFRSFHFSKVRIILFQFLFPTHIAFRVTWWPLAFGFSSFRAVMKKLATLLNLSDTPTSLPFCAISLTAYLYLAWQWNADCILCCLSRSRLWRSQVEDIYPFYHFIILSLNQ